MELTPDEKLDTFLEYFINPEYAQKNGEIASNKLAEIYRKDKRFSDDDLSEYDMILRKLYKLEYINVNSNGLSVNLTFDGKYFIKSGGFIEQKKVNATENQRILNSEKRNYHATVWVAIGAGSLVVWEVVKYCMENCGCH